MPVFKVNNAPEKGPVRPPWMRQDSIPQVNNSAPWRRQQSVNKSEPPGEPVTPPQQQRKQSKIEIIPTVPSNKNIPSILAVPPSLPAPPSNPNLAIAKKETTPIQVSSRKVTKPKAEAPKQEAPKKEPSEPKPAAANGVQKKNAINEEKSFKATVLDLKTAENKPVESAKPEAPKSTAQQKPAPVKRQQTVQENQNGKEQAPAPVKSAPKEPERPQKAAPKEQEKPQKEPEKPQKVAPKEAEKPQREPEKPQKPAPKPQKETEKPQKEVEKPKTEPPKQVAMPPPPPPPSMPPAPPPPPAMPGQKAQKPIPENKKAKLDSLRSRPRRRPDWVDMMKEVESGVKLRKVQCNDRSQPLLPKVKAKGQFIYESERSHSNIHIALLNQIQRGAKLKKVNTNDRSRPNLQGLRKFRRQLTIEEQQQGSKPASGSEDELDDIDKVRDDLQSTKQMVQIETAEKLRLKSENERLLEELAKLREQMAGMTRAPAAGSEDPILAQLRREAEEAKAEAAKQEAMAQNANRQLGLVQAQLEDAQHRCLVLEKRTGGSVPESSSAGTQTTDLQRAESRREARREQTPVAAESEEEEEEETEEETEDEEEEEEDEDAAKQTQELRDLRMQQAKLRTLKEKAFNALDEKRALRFQVNNLQKALRQEQKRFSALQREVSKMTKEEAESDEEEEEEEESSESESETETESEQESDPEDMSDPPQFRTEALIKKNKVHENRLNLIKKGNYLLKATVDKLKESLDKQQSKTMGVQQELNTIVAELG